VTAKRPTPRRRVPTIDALVDGVRAGDRAMLGQAITLVESRRDDHRRRAQDLLARLLPYTGGAHRVGITGVPGVGKSTFVESIGVRLADAGHRVAVLAVDPSSAVSGGSILGDKTRMQRLSVHPGAFVRPSPTAGSLGGVARRTRESMLVCEAAGYDIVLVETVGVGQSETTVAGMVDMFVVLMLAGAGDELQGIKKGILEVADLIAINKADGDNVDAARRARREYASALHYVRPSSPSWTPPVVTCSAMTGDGLGELWDEVRAHRDALSATGELDAKRRAQRVTWMWAMIEDGLHRRFRAHPGVAAALEAAESGVRDGTTPATQAALDLLDAFTGE